jgi:hypothetical protein
VKRIVAVPVCGGAAGWVGMALDLYDFRRRSGKAGAPPMSTVSDMRRADILEQQVGRRCSILEREHWAIGTRS